MAARRLHGPQRHPYDGLSHGSLPHPARRDRRARRGPPAKGGPGPRPPSGHGSALLIALPGRRARTETKSVTRTRCSTTTTATRPRTTTTTTRTRTGPRTRSSAPTRPARPRSSRRPCRRPPGSDPLTNKVECYNHSQTAKHWELDNLIGVFCNELAKYAVYQNYRESSDGWELARTLYSDQLRSAPIEFNFIINKGCTLDIEGDDYSRYLHVAVDACDCGGMDGKQGGAVKNNCFYWRIDPNIRWS